MYQESESELQNVFHTVSMASVTGNVVRVMWGQQSQMYNVILSGDTTGVGVKGFSV